MIKVGQLYETSQTQFEVIEVTTKLIRTKVIRIPEAGSVWKLGELENYNHGIFSHYFKLIRDTVKVNTKPEWL